MRRDVLSILAIVSVALAGVVATIVSGNEPLLGIDLQGGVSVVLEPDGEATDQQLDDAIEIIRSRVDSFGVAEPDIIRNGQTIEVALPGTTEDQQDAIALVEQTAELRFRPLLGVAPSLDSELALSSSSAVGDASSSTATSDASSTSAAEPGSSTSATNATTTTLPESAGQVPTTTAGPVPSSAREASTTAAPDSSTTIAPLPDPVAADPDPAATLGSQARCLAEFEARADDETLVSESGIAPVEEESGATLPEDDLLCDVVTVAAEDPQFGPTLKTLGPTAFTGVKLSGADARFQDLQWVIEVRFTGGSDPGDGAVPAGGSSLFDEMATVCVAQSPECPTNQLAFVLDGEVLSDPTFNTTAFGGTAVISGSFTEEEAKSIAIALRFGALPVTFENQGVQTVSASIGEDALNAGIISGLVGLALVALFIISYYRWFGVVAIASLVLSASMLWTIIAWLGSSRGLALTLAGITGIVVSIGVSLDSNIVYFEHLKEDVRNGRTPRSSVDRAFPIAFSTIVKADVASLIGSGLLYWLTTGAVRGFALYLGVATILDLVATYFFLGPAIRLLARRKSFETAPSRYGIPTEVVSEVGA